MATMAQNSSGGMGTPGKSTKRHVGEFLQIVDGCSCITFAEGGMLWRLGLGFLKSSFKHVSFAEIIFSLLSRCL